MYHPPRGGVRGGRGLIYLKSGSIQFDVKTDKHRENYLGHSLHAPVGRWQQGKDLTWYAKDGKQDDSHRKEIMSIKDTEADVMAELLGGGKRRVVTGNVTQQELTNVLKRQQDEDDDNLKEVTKGFRSSGRLSISEMIPDDARLIPEGTLLQKDKGGSVTNWDDRNIVEGTQASMLQSGDKKRAKKIKKEKKKKKRKKEKHHSNKEKHRKRSKRELSASSQEEDASNESIRGRSRYRKIDKDHTGSRHSKEFRPYSNSPKHDTRRYRSRSSKRRGILRDRSRSRSTSTRRNNMRYLSRSNSPKREAIRSKSPRREAIRSKSPRREAIRSKSPRREAIRSKSPRREAIKYRSRSKSPRRDAMRYRSPRRGAIRHRSRSKSPKREVTRRSPNTKYTRSWSRDRYRRSDDDRRKFGYSYGTGNDRRDRDRVRSSRDY